MPEKNLSEELFKPRFEHPETSSLVRHIATNPAGSSSVMSAKSPQRWYRTLTPLVWNWRGVPAIEINEVLSRVAASSLARTNEQQLDTVRGYRNGNWIYEWSVQAARWQQLAQQQQDPTTAGKYWLHAANLFSVAAYPHLNGDELADQAQVLAYRAYEQATGFLSGELKSLSFKMEDGKTVNAFLHMPEQVKPPYPVVMLCGGLDTLQLDHFRLFHDYLAPRGLAMLTLDMPSVGYSSRWRLTQDTSMLHQQVLRQLTDVPWIDHRRVGVWGHRFGANVAVRLAYLEIPRLRAVACQEPIVHGLLTDPSLQQAVPDMFLDILASRLGKTTRSDATLSTEMNAYSLKTQGLLGRRTPVPMLSACRKNNLYSPAEDSELICNSSAKGKLVWIADTPVMKSFERTTAEISDWLAGLLKR